MDYSVFDEIEAIQDLVAGGLDDEEICARTGIEIKRIRDIMQLQNLIPGLQQGLKGGLIKLSVAVKIAKLSPSAQRILQRRMQGYITAQQVAEVKRRMSAKKMTTGTLPLPLFS